MREKEYDKMHSSFCRTSSGSRRTCSLWGLSVPTLPCTLPLSFAKFPCILNPLEFCANGLLQILHVNGVARNNKHAYCTYLLCVQAWSIIPLDFTYKTQVQDKIKNLKTVTMKHYPKHEALVARSQDCTPMNLALVFREKSSKVIGP